jgi:hypothetical protein
MHDPLHPRIPHCRVERHLQCEMTTKDNNQKAESERAMKTDIANTTPARRGLRHTLGSAVLVAVAAVLLQGCTTARPTWSYRADANPLAPNAFERVEPREGIALINFNF